MCSEATRASHIQEAWMGSKFLFTGSSPVGTGTREIMIDGNTMTQNVTFTMGKDTPVQKITVVYKKK